MIPEPSQVCFDSCMLFLKVCCMHLATGASYSCKTAAQKISLRNPQLPGQVQHSAVELTASTRKTALAVTMMLILHV